MATKATSMPCHDFYNSIKDGVKDAMGKLQVMEPKVSPATGS